MPVNKTFLSLICLKFIYEVSSTRKLFESRSVEFKVDRPKKYSVEENFAGRSYFSSEIIPVIKELVPEVNVQKNVLELHKSLSVSLRIISSNKLVDIEAYKSLIKEIENLLINRFNCTKFNYTLHGAFQHSAQLIAENCNRDLGVLSEELLKAINKVLRRYMLNLSRKSYSELQLVDVITRAIEIH